MGGEEEEEDGLVGWGGLGGWGVRWSDRTARWCQQSGAARQRENSLVCFHPNSPLCLWPWDIHSPPCPAHSPPPSTPHPHPPVSYFRWMTLQGSDGQGVGGSEATGRRELNEASCTRQNISTCFPQKSFFFLTAKMTLICIDTEILSLKVHSWLWEQHLAKNPHHFLVFIPELSATAHGLLQRMEVWTTWCHVTKTPGHVTTATEQT